jgi:hypothetical protein
MTIILIFGLRERKICLGISYLLGGGGTYFILNF